MRSVFCLWAIWCGCLACHAGTIGMATVIAETAPIYRGKKVIATAKKGDALSVVEIKDSWYGVRPARGWIHKKYVKFEKRSTSETEPLRPAQPRAAKPPASIKPSGPLPGKDFSPEAFFRFRLEHPKSTALPKWLEAYEDYWWQQAERRDIDIYLERYARYVTLRPDSKRLPVVYQRMFDDENMPYGFEREVNFVLYDEYVRRRPKGEYSGKITVGQLIENELDYLRELYLDAPVARAIKLARSRRAPQRELQKLLDLQQEIRAFDELDIANEPQCHAFATKYPQSPQLEVICQCIFERIEPRFRLGSDASLVPKITRWVPKKEAEAFCAKAWDSLAERTKDKGPGEQLAVLKPWLVAAECRFVSVPERVFLTDVLSWAALLCSQERDETVSAISNLTAAAVLYSTWGDVFQLFKPSTPPDADDMASMQRRQREMQEQMRKGLHTRGNLTAARDLLDGMGTASFRAGTPDFLAHLAQARPKKEADRRKAVEALKEKMTKTAGERGEYREACLVNLRKSLRRMADCWPALQPLTLFPDARALEAVVLMPRFYDSLHSIEEYLGKHQDESLELAKKWLSDPAASDRQKARAFFILGFHKTPWDGQGGAGAPKLDDEAFFYHYYCLRIGSGDVEEHRRHLVAAATNKKSMGFISRSPNRTALMLYHRTRGDEPTPPELRKWLIDEIEQKKYNDNHTVWVFYPLIQRLPEAEKAEVVEKMFTSYNLDWWDIASSAYEDMIPKGLARDAVVKILEGSVPWKKAALVKALGGVAPKEYQREIEDFLLGRYYTDGDRELIRRNVKNKLTKDISLGYNETINWSVVNREIDKAEPKLRAALILTTSSGLDSLPFARSAGVIQERFLGDHALCIAGASWLLKNYDPREGRKPDFSSMQEPGTDFARAVLAFLRGHFSEPPSYSPYLAACEKLKDHDRWPALVGLGSGYVETGIFQAIKEGAHVANPVADPQMDVLLSNVRSRYLMLLCAAKGER